MVKPEELVAAGGLLSVKEKLKSESTVDLISARHFTHSALGTRPVVRLVADNLAAGEDLTLEFLGFSKPEVIGPIAKRQRQALGFPGWALVNDPKHARYALELVKEFKKAARKSKAKPGHGYDEFVETSKQLGASVAHFLPSFWEQVGREFIALDNSTYASRAFGKAREAEKVHALKVDESTRQDAFLEFALAGAVSIKALTEYGKELLTTHDPKEAWTFFRELCVRRILGGMPPWPAMLKDLQTLIKAAGLDQDQEVQSILSEVIDSPAISRASMGFWESASKSIAKLVKRDSHVAGVLLNMIPQTSGWRNEDTWPWLKYLEAWGLLENLWKESVPEAAQPQGGAGAWLTRIIRSVSRPRQPIFDLLQSLAPRLRTDAKPVDLYLKTGWRNQGSLDVDLMDLALSLKVPLADPPENAQVDLDDWASLDDADEGAKDRPRDPIHLVSDSRFTKILRNAVQESSGQANFEMAASGKAGLRQARQEWLDSLVSGLSVGALPALQESLRTIQNRAARAIFKEFPEALEKLQTSDLITPILRTLQGGLIDEYGWPALERVVEAWKLTPTQQLQYFGPFPYLVITDGLKVIVLKDDAVVHEAELKLPKGQKLEFLLFIDGDLLVWSCESYRTVCFWNSDPQPTDPSYQYFGDHLDGVSIEFPSGGTLVGEKIVHRGDKPPQELKANDNLYSDGSHCWIRSHDWDQVLNESISRLQELDPQTGKKGRDSMPSFFEDFLAHDLRLDFSHSSLLPVGKSFENSPLGKRDGLIGSRVRTGKKQAGPYRIESIDGRAVEVPQSAEFSGLLNQPGTNDFLPVGLREESSSDSGVKLWGPDGSYVIADVDPDANGYGHGQVATVPVIYLHAFQLRDAATSQKLRQLTQPALEKLLAAARQDFEKQQAEKITLLDTGGSHSRRAIVVEESKHFPILDKAISKQFGSKIDPRLHIGIRGLLILADKTQRHYERILTQRLSEADAPEADPESTSVELALQSYLSDFSYEFEVLPSLSFLDSVKKLASFFRGEISNLHFADCWFDVIKTISEGLPRRLWREYCSGGTKKGWGPFIQAWGELPFQDLPGWFRRFDAETDNEEFLKAEHLALNEAHPLKKSDYDDDDEDWNWTIPVVGKSSRFLVHKTYGNFEILEYSPDGNFEAIPGLTEDPDSVSVSPPTIWSGATLKKFAQLALAKPVNLPPVELIQSVAAAVQATPAEVALVWFGLPHFSDYSSNFMPSALREGCQLKTKECSAARESLKTMPESILNALVDSVIAGDPEQFWATPPTEVAERLKAAWSGGSVSRLPLSPEWVARLTDVICYGVDNAKMLEALNNPEASQLFRATGTCSIKCDADEVALSNDGGKGGVDEDVLNASLNCMALLAYGLPVGDPARGKVPQVYAALNRALAHPGLMLIAGRRYEFDAKSIAACNRLVESSVGKLKTDQKLQIADDGVTLVASASDEYLVAFRPAKLTSSAAFDRFANQMSALFKDQDDDDGDSSTSIVNHLRVLNSAEFKGISERIEKTPVAVGNYENNPMCSVPDLVKQVVQKFELSEDAAVYYLQLLALPDPIDKNIVLWNGWKPAILKKLAAELIGKNLVLEATRSRAGRKYFLAGGWEDLKSPHLPIETWKLPLFQMTRDSYQRATPPLERIVPLEPVHTLFEKAWKRIVAGDLPRYEEVKKSSKKK